MRLQNVFTEFEIFMHPRSQSSDPVLCAYQNPTISTHLDGACISVYEAEQITHSNFLLRPTESYQQLLPVRMLAYPSGQSSPDVAAHYILQLPGKHSILQDAYSYFRCWIEG